MALLNTQLGVIGIKVPGDNQCLFSALARNAICTIGRQNVLIDAKYMRKNVVSWLRANKDLYEEFFSKEEKEETYEEYCDNMEKKSTWGGELEITASIDFMREDAGMENPNFGIIILDHNRESGYSLTKHTEYPGHKGGNYLIYNRSSPSKKGEGMHYDFACDKDKLRSPWFGGAPITDEKLLEAFGLPPLQKSVPASTPNRSPHKPQRICVQVKCSSTNETIFEYTDRHYIILRPN